MTTQLRLRLPVLVCAAGAVASAAVVWLAMPHDREVKALWILLVKLVPFAFGVETIARLELSPAARRRLALAAVPAAFLVYFCYFVPKIFFTSDDGNQLYYYVLTLTPFVILAFVLAYRLGGGRAGTCRRLGYAMLLLQLSGLEDLAFLTVNHQTDPKWTPIPEVWTWASHMTVFIGHPPTKYQAFAFIGTHVVLALLVLFLPARAATALARRIGRRPAAGGTVAAAGTVADEPAPAEPAEAPRPAEPAEAPRPAEPAEAGPAGSAAAGDEVPDVAPAAR
jgi:hypothetical protein